MVAQVKAYWPALIKDAPQAMATEVMRVWAEQWRCAPEILRATLEQATVTQMPAQVRGTAMANVMPAACR